MSRRLSLTFFLPVAILVLGLGAMAGRVQAGPVTGGGGVAPFVKLGVYQGLISIIPTGGSNVMVVGNAGRDITSTGTLYLRPGGLTADRVCVGGTNPGTSCPLGNECLNGGFCQNQAARLYKYPSYAEAVLDLGSGQLCLHGSGSSDCRSAWPSSGGSGDPYWQTSTVSGLSVLSPVSPSSPTIANIRIGQPSSPVPSSNGRALEVYGNYAGPALHVNTLYTNDISPIDYSYIGTGTVLINGSLKAGRVGTLTENQNASSNANVWSSADNYLINTYYPTDPETHTSDVSRIDADTFDRSSLTSMLFPNNGDLYIRSLNFASPPWGAEYSYQSICIKTSANGLCVKGTSIGKSCTVDGDCPGGGAGSCQTMCASTQLTCAADRVYTTNPVAPTDTGKFCNASSGKLWTKSCFKPGTNTQYQQACNVDADCSSLGAGVICRNTTCFDYWTCSAPAPYAVSCTPGDPTWGNAHCNTVKAGSTCTVAAATCPSGGTCRATDDTAAVIPNTTIGVKSGFCYNFVPCTDDAQCGGSAGQSNFCTAAGFCSDGNDVGAYTGPITKHCVGGSRSSYICAAGSPRAGQYCNPGYPGTIGNCGTASTAACVSQEVRCDQSNICIGGIADSQYDNHDAANVAACNNYNGYASTYPALAGQPGNAVDYCPGGGTCVPDTLCFDTSECDSRLGLVCTKTVALTASNFGSCNDAVCDNFCKSTAINRCSGQTNVFGNNTNACTANGFGQNLNYTGGSCQCGNDTLCPQFDSAFCVCNTNTQPRSYVTGTIGSGGEICTAPFQ